MTRATKLLRIVRRSRGSVVTWRRAQMVLLSAQGMVATAMAEVTFLSADRVRDVLTTATPTASTCCSRRTAVVGRRS